MRWEEKCESTFDWQRKRRLQQTWDESCFRWHLLADSHCEAGHFHKETEYSDCFFTIGHVLGIIADDFVRQAFFLPSITSYTGSLAPDSRRSTLFHPNLQTSVIFGHCWALEIGRKNKGWLDVTERWPSHGSLMDHVFADIHYRIPHFSWYIEYAVHYLPIGIILRIVANDLLRKACLSPKRPPTQALSLVFAYIHLIIPSAHQFGVHVGDDGQLRLAGGGRQDWRLAQVWLSYLYDLARLFVRMSMQKIVFLLTKWVICLLSGHRTHTENQSQWFSIKDYQHNFVIGSYLAISGLWQAIKISWEKYAVDYSQRMAFLVGIYH